MILRKLYGVLFPKGWTVIAICPYTGDVICRYWPMHGIAAHRQAKKWNSEHRKHVPGRPTVEYFAVLQEVALSMSEGVLHVEWHSDDEPEDFTVHDGAARATGANSDGYVNAA